MMNMEREFNTNLLKQLEKEGSEGSLLEHVLSSLLNTFPDHIYLKDRNSRFILVNESMMKTFNLKTPEEALNKTDFDFFSEEHAGAAYEDEQEIMKTGQGKTNFVEKETWEDGTVTWVASTKVPLYDGERNIIGLFGISRDITARRVAEMDNDNRIRELDCFLEISRNAKRKELGVEGFIGRITELIPRYFVHISVESVRVVIGNKAFKKPDFIETPYSRKYKIRENNKKIGTMEVFLSEDVKKISKTTDLVMELIADRITEVIERNWLERDLRKWEHILRDSENHSDLYL